MIKVLSDKSPVTRLHAATMLLLSKNDAGALEMTHLVGDPQDDIAYEAAAIVGAAGRMRLLRPEAYFPPHPECARSLLAVAQSTRSADVRVAAIEALGGFGSLAREHETAIKELASSPDGTIAFAASRALEEIARSR